MNVRFLIHCLAAMGAALVLASATAAAEDSKRISRAERAADAIEIQNIMGRYSIYIVANQWLEIGNMFALDEPDVRQSAPFDMSGPAVRAYFVKRAQETLQPGVFYQHSFMAPLIEVAGDGKTAKGVWDSIGVNAQSGDTMANWSWMRYAIDFKKINDEWKIWHMKVLPLWRAPYGEAWATMVQQASKGTKTGGGTATAATATPPAPEKAAPRTGGAPASNYATHWRYSGTDLTPVLPANPPKPYYTFDVKDAY